MADVQGVLYGRYEIRVLALASLIAVGCSEVSRPVGPTGVALDRYAQAGPVGDMALRGDPGLGPDLAAVRRATAAFHEVERAIEAGYADPRGAHCDESAAGAMGVHSGNPALVQSQALDPAQPEVLLYLPTEEGGVRLIGVEYLQPVLLRNPVTGVVAPWFAQAPWPANYIVVTPTPQLFGQTFQGPMPGHVPGMPWHWDLHVWVWANNPSGMFAQWNPALSCDGEV
jgi:hypothetical protein